MHLVFYDGECGLCDHVVQFLLWADRKGIFVYAPLQGETARKFLKDLPEEYRTADSLILIEDYKGENPKSYLFGKGALRIAWLLGGPWALLGVVSFLPAWLYDWAYRLVARNRHRLFSVDSCRMPDPSFKNRFLP